VAVTGARKKERPKKELTQLTCGSALEARSKYVFNKRAVGMVAEVILTVAAEVT